MYFTQRPARQYFHYFKENEAINGLLYSSYVVVTIEVNNCGS